MNTLLLLLSILHFLVLGAIFAIEKVIVPTDVFSPGRILVYFKLVYSLSLTWFAVNDNALVSLIFSQVAPEYQSNDLVVKAYVYSLFGVILIYAGIFCGAYVRHRYSIAAMTSVLGLRTFERPRSAWRAGLIMVFAGLAVYTYFLEQLGGLVDLWQNLAERAERSAGLGYFQKFYEFSLVFGSSLAFSALLKARRRWLAGSLVIITTLVLVSLGQRAPAIAYLFGLYIVYHYRVRTVRNVITLKNAAFAIIMLTFLLVAVQFRHPGSIERYAVKPNELFFDSMHTFERHIVQRFGRLERDIVILGYFNTQSYWFGRSYMGLMMAPLPRSHWPEKPPIDTGRYLLAMAHGEVVTPPVPVTKLPSSSWPDGNWAGYMNFSVPGFVTLFWLSGAFLGVLYQLVRRTNYNVAAVVIYSAFAWSGSVNLSPMGIVDICMYLGLLFIWTYLFRFNRSLLNALKIA